MRFFRPIVLAAGFALCALAAAPALSQQGGPEREPVSASVQDAKSSAPEPNAPEPNAAHASAAYVLSMACRIQCPSDPQVASSVACRRISEEECSATAEQASACSVDYIFSNWCTTRETSPDASGTNQ
jgi:hypothetical protein